LGKLLRPENVCNESISWNRRRILQHVINASLYFQVLDDFQMNQRSQSNDCIQNQPSKSSSTKKKKKK
jgi:hypothetical protein